MERTKPYLLVVFIVLFSAGCATSPPKPKSGNLYNDFLNGDIRLECVLSCGGAFGANLLEMTQLYNAGIWEELAEKVYSIGQNQNIAYFYLGRAAEGLEKYQAAETYYLLAQSAPSCVFNGCQGLVFPDVILNRLTIVKKKKSSFDITDTYEAAKTGTSTDPTTENMACKTNADCSPSETCRSKSGGGTRCIERLSLTDENLTFQSQENPLEKLGRFESKEEVKLIYSGGVYEIPITLNNVLKINVILDSGASEVSIAPDVALTLIRTGTITKNDFLEGAVYQFADGSSARSERFKLKSILIGNREIKNVNCSIANSIEAPMLLGQSALHKLGKFTIDYKKRVIQFE